MKKTVSGHSTKCSCPWAPPLAGGKECQGPESSLWLISSGPSRLLLPVSSSFLSHVHQSGLRERQREPDVVTHTCHIKLRQGDGEFEAILHYVEKHHHLHRHHQTQTNKQTNRQSGSSVCLLSSLGNCLFFACRQRGHSGSPALPNSRRSLYRS